MRKKHDPNKHLRYPRGAIVNGVNVGGKFMPKQGRFVVLVGQNKPVRAIAAKLAQKTGIKATTVNRKLMSAVKRALSAHRASGGDDDQKTLRRVAMKAIADEVRAISGGRKGAALKQKKPASPKPDRDKDNLTATSDSKTLNKKFAAWEKQLKQMDAAVYAHAFQEKIIIAERTIRNLSAKQGTDFEVELQKQLIEETKLKIEELKPRLEKNPYTGVDIKRLNASRLITESLLLNKREKNKIGIIDGEGNLQAAFKYATKKDRLYIDLLATSPWNITPDDPRRVKGAGTQAIVEAIKLSKKKGFKGRVALTPLSDAEPFYEKLGFRVAANRIGYEWELSPEKADDLLRKLGKL